MGQYKHLCSGWIFGYGLTDTWDVGQRPILLAEVCIYDPCDSDYSGEYEFEWEPITTQPNNSSLNEAQVSPETTNLPMCMANK